MNFKRKERENFFQWIHEYSSTLASNKSVLKKTVQSTLLSI